MKEEKLENLIRDIYIKGYRLKPLAQEWGYEKTTDLVADMLEDKLGVDRLTEMAARFKFTQHDVNLFFEDESN